MVICPHGSILFSVGSCGYVVEEHCRECPMSLNMNESNGRAMMVVDGLVVRVTVRDFGMEPSEKRSQLADQLATANGLVDRWRTSEM